MAIPVVTGLSDGVYTEIISGIEKGQVLAVGISLAGSASQPRRSLLTGNQAQF